MVRQPHHSGHYLMNLAAEYAIAKMHLFFISFSLPSLLGNYETAVGG